MTTRREHWGSKLGFMLATAGSAVGLGSLWRFPYAAGENGGGAFVLMYLLFTFVLGVPLFIAELVIGRSTQRSPVGAYFELSGHSKNWRLAGWFCIFSCFTILSFYNVISGWALNYTFMSLNQFFVGRSPDGIREVFDIFYASGDMNIFWHFLFMLLTVGVVWAGVRKGIEHWSKILMPILLVMLVALFAYGLTLDGFTKAFHFIFYPNVGNIKPSSILGALGMAMFTLSLGLGIVLTYGSYMKSSDDIAKTALIIQVLNVSVTLLAALVIFPIIFSFGQEPQQGVGLVFKTLPVLFSKMEGALVISTGFFVLMVFTALTSTISLMEVIVANFTEMFNWPRKKAVLAVGAASFLFGIPCALAGSGQLFGNWEAIYGKDFLMTIADLADWQLPLGGLMIAIFTGWIVDKELLKKEFSHSKARFLFWPWYNFVKWLVPISIVFILLFQQTKILDIDGLLMNSP